MTRLAVLVSGTGSNLKAIVSYGLHVSLVIADRPCPALLWARNEHIPSVLVPSRTLPDMSIHRERFSLEISRHLEDAEIELVALAGLQVLLGGTLIRRYRDRILNIHPSLLPSYPGRHAVRDALVARERETGCTVHVVDELMDHGRRLASSRVPIIRGDTPRSLHARIKKAEHAIYPPAIKRYMQTLPRSSS